MFEAIKKLFKEDKAEKAENDEKEEIDYKKYIEQNTPAYLTMRVNDYYSFYEIELHFYLKGDYLGRIIADRAKIEALDSDEEKRILDMIFKMIHDREEELKQQKLRKEIAKEKLEFMRLRNEMLKKKLGKDEEETK